MHAFGDASIGFAEDAGADSLRPLERRDERLDSGALLLVVQGDPGSGAAIVASFDAGEAFVPTRFKGLATLAARTLRAGSTDHPGAAFDAALAAIGATLDTRVNADLLEVSIEVAPARIPDAIDLLAELLARPAYPAEEFERQRRKLLEEIAAPKDTEELARALLARVLYDRHPYAYRPTAESVARIRAEDLLKYHQRRIGADGATIAIAGELGNEIALIQRARRALAAMAPGVPADRRRAYPPPQTKRRVLLHHREGESTAAVALGNVGLSTSDPDLPTALLVEQIVGDRRQGRIATALLDNRVPSLGFRAGFEIGRDTGLFEASATFEPAWVDTGTATLLDALDRVRHEPIFTDEIEIAVATHDIAHSERIRRALLLARETIEVSKAGLSPRWSADFGLSLQLLSSLDVSRAARRLIRLYASPLVFVGDGTAIAASIARFGSVIWIDEAGNPLPAHLRPADAQLAAPEEASRRRSIADGGNGDSSSEEEAIYTEWMRSAFGVEDTLAPEPAASDSMTEARAVAEPQRAAPNESPFEPIEPMPADSFEWDVGWDVEADTMGSTIDTLEAAPDTLEP